MAATIPTTSKCVVDPDTSDIDGLVFVAAAELRHAGIEIDPDTLAQRLNVPRETVQQHWLRLAPLLAA